jgi:pimeloyl-ACP methyl ester carboxylesterase
MKAFTFRIPRPSAAAACMCASGVSDASPQLFLLHGWCDVSASWQFVVDALAGDWRIVAPDWRGFGLSEWNNDVYWFPDYIADLDALLHHYSPDESGAPGRPQPRRQRGLSFIRESGRRAWRKLVNLEGLGLRRYTPDEAPGRYANWLDQLRDTPAFRSYPDRAGLCRAAAEGEPAAFRTRKRTLSWRSTWARTTVRAASTWPPIPFIAG